MRERLQRLADRLDAFGGSLTVTSAAGHGTSVSGLVTLASVGDAAAPRQAAVAELQASSS